jgi:hypothetical protein
MEVGQIQAAAKPDAVSVESGFWTAKRGEIQSGFRILTSKVDFTEPAALVDGCNCGSICA